MTILSEEALALLNHMDADDAIQAAARAGWNAAIEAAAEAIEAMVESVGDAASYDQRDMTSCEYERMHTANEAVKLVLALKEQK